MLRPPMALGLWTLEMLIRGNVIISKARPWHRWPDLSTDVRRVGRFACGLWVDALEPGPVSAGGVPLVAV